MSRVRVAAVMPYALVLPDGEYDTPPVGSLSLRAALFPEDEGVTVRTRARWWFEAPDDLDPQAAERTADREAGGLLARVNRLLRWYRLLAARPDVLELTLGAMSPFLFTLADSGEPWQVPRREYERAALPPTGRVSLGDVADELRRRLATGADPDPAQLTLLDAEYAAASSRFRDAVLLCWSVIDSSVVRTFESLVDRKLAGEWAQSLEFLKGAEYGLRHKMTSGLKLLCGRSLFEDNVLWRDLSDSYRTRNDIIHRNEGARVGEAGKALQVARRVLSFLKEIET